MKRISFSYELMRGERCVRIKENKGNGRFESVVLTPDEAHEVYELSEVETEDSHLEDPADYSNIRESIGKFIGRRILDIVQHDKDEWEADKRSYVQLLLEGGDSITFYIGPSGFSHSEEIE